MPLSFPDLVFELTHNIADILIVYIGWTLNDYFVVDVPNDEHIREVPNGVAENISSDSLDNILDEFRTVALDAAPVFPDCPFLYS